MGKLKIILSFAVILGVISGNCQYVFNKVTVDQGLSSNRIRCVLKDRDGFIWIGTEYGLNRFDGSDVVTFFNLPGNNNSLSENFVLSLYQDIDGAIWIGTRNGGINILDPRSLTFKSFFHDINDTTSVSGDGSKLIFADRKDQVWCAIADQGLDLFNKNDSTFSNFKPTDQYPELVSRLANSLICYALDPINNDQIWLGCILG
ncbi:MAG: hypothetical protein K8R53_04115, partial [Bacteroidales bacterium]|nr:hypothetical protein [Bacteroidales bacterium]